MSAVPASSLHVTEKADGEAELKDDAEEAEELENSMCKDVQLEKEEELKKVLSGCADSQHPEVCLAQLCQKVRKAVQAVSLYFLV